MRLVWRLEAAAIGVLVRWRSVPIRNTAIEHARLDWTPETLRPLASVLPGQAVDTQLVDAESFGSGHAAGAAWFPMGAGLRTSRAKLNGRAGGRAGSGGVLVEAGRLFRTKKHLRRCLGYPLDDQLGVSRAGFHGVAPQRFP
jgi:membrane-associated phospholipid phosphatase